ncbi:helix-turn-helix domain-containing protein [Paeniglutamicibacter sp. NPDC091659]|uniref:helix-turn-helix domain-containing protein n=1 Tax=Paeniglutamicibacter sp. NPDC091659 TaxID=3364389 RepID=UPI00382B6ED3
MDEWSHYRQPAPPLRNLGLVCLGAGEQSGRLPSFSGRTLSSHALVIVSEGTGLFNSGGKAEKLRAPALLWLFPGVSHGYGPSPGGWSEHWVLFAGPTARAFEELGYLPREPPWLQLVEGQGPDLDATLGLFAGLRTALRLEGPRGDLEASVLTQRVLLDAGRHVHAVPVGPHERLLSGLRETAHLQLGLREQAALHGVSPSELRRAVQDATGVGPKEFVLQLRMSRAQSLLADTALPIQRISRLVGYEDPAYFSRLFSERSGQSPTHFRMQHRRES